MKNIGGNFNPCTLGLGKVFSCSEPSDEQLDACVNLQTMDTSARSLTITTVEGSINVETSTDVHAYLNCKHGEQVAWLCECIGIAAHPTYVIVDSGCTRAMGSRHAIDRFVQTCSQHKDHSQI